MVVKVVYKGSFGRKFEIKTRGSAFSVDLIDEITILCTRSALLYQLPASSCNELL